MVDIITVCPFCGKEHIVTVPVAGFLMWQTGMSIQDAMPTVSADDHEMLMSGICPDCW